jgi:hypothetical protein
MKTEKLKRKETEARMTEEIDMKVVVHIRKNRA